MWFSRSLTDEQVEERFAEARSRLQDGDHAAAERIYRELAKQRPQDPRWMNGLGFVREHAGDDAAALELYRRAAELGLPQAYYNTGRIAYLADEHERAVEALERAEQLGFRGAENLLGDAHLALGRHADAERAYVRAAKRGDDNAHANLGLLYLETDEPARAIGPFTRALELGHVHAEHNLGSAHHRLGELDEAARWYTRSWQRHGNLQSMENLGHVWRTLGRVEDGQLLVHASDMLAEGRPVSERGRDLIAELDRAEV